MGARLRVRGFYEREIRETRGHIVERRFSAGVRPPVACFPLKRRRLYQRAGDLIDISFVTYVFTELDRGKLS